MSSPLSAHRTSHLRGTARVPGDKSISHRALILGALATGTTTVQGLLKSEDVLATAGALEAMGVVIVRGADEWRIHGRGVGGLHEPDAPIDFGNTGTGIRLMMGVFAGHDFQVSLTGDESLSRRPMARVLRPLMEMGLHVDDDRDRLPLTLRGSRKLVPLRYELPVPSAQVKSAILLAGLHAPGRTTVIETAATRDHTERMLQHFGAQVEASSAETASGEAATAITVAGNAELNGCHVSVPADPSSAAFPVAAALLVPDAEIKIDNVMVNPTRAGLLDVLRRMGADLQLENQRTSGGEPIADIRVRSSRLTGCHVPADVAPTMIDEYPMLACLAAFADGQTRMDGLAELRVKECDRLAVTAAGLEAQGVTTAIDGDTLIVNGRGTSGSNGVPGGGTVATELDHRIAMAFLMMGLATEQPVTVDDTRMIATSFPGFADLMSGLGARFA